MSDSTDHLAIDQLARFASGLLDDDSFESAAAHLAGCDACGRLAESLPADNLARRLRIANEAVRSTDTTSVYSLAGSPKSGDATAMPNVPGYELLAVLGCGGMGVVYQARDTRLKRLVALKMIRGNLTPALLARFQAEAEAVARLNHPHIVGIHEIGQCPPAPGGSGMHYLALEFAPGGSLDRRLRKQRPTPHEAAQLLEILARAVHAAHEAGIVNRDLKPANILLADAVAGSSGNTVFGFPKVSDFGVARFMSPVTDETGHTGTGVIVGTASYMAPEQADGDNRSVGPSADIYALGAILYECLTGKPPFRGKSSLDILVQVSTEPPVPPSQSAENVPVDLERICLTCLNKSPGDRYPSGAALADDLRRFLDGQPPMGGGTVDHVPPKAENRPLPPTPCPQRRGGDSPTRKQGERLLQKLSVVETHSGRRWLALALLLGLCAAGGLAWRLWPAGSAGKAGVAAAEPLKGWIDVTVTEKDNKERQLLHLGDRGALPLKVNDEVRVDAELNRPAYMYIVWIDTRGKVLPVYPWREGEWGNRPEQEERVKRVSLPEKAGEVWPINPGRPGLETLLLLTREEPLGAEVDLATVLAGLGSEKMEDERDMAWFENGLLVRDEPRRAPTLKSKPGSNSLVRINAVLQEGLGRYFSYTRAVTFANRGGQEK